MTLEAWVRPSTVTNKWRDVIYKGDDNYYLEATSNSGSKPAGGGTFGGANANVFGTSALAANTWAHLALTYDGTTLRFYVNGSQVATQARTGTIATSTNQLQLGGDSFNGNQYFSGLIDDVRVYSIALSAAAIQTDMATPVGSGDTTPPSAPGTLTSSVIGSGEIDLSWAAATDNVGVTGYQIWRCQGSGCSNFTLLAQPAGTATTYKDTNVAPSTSYSYQVKAVDAAGNVSAPSNAVSATTTAGQDTQPPSTPTGLATSGVGQNSMTLSWNAASDNVGVTGYLLYVGGSQVGTSLTTSFLFTNLTCGTSYTLGVAAVDAATNVSAVATLGRQTAACPDSTPPSAPGTLTSSVVGSSEVDLSWGPATDNVGVTAYQILRCQGAGCGSFALLTQQTGTGTTYKDIGLAANTSYSYQVRAVDAAGNQGPTSNTSSSTTQQASASGLVAAYSFDEGSGTTTADASGTGNTGTLSGATWTTAGKYGGALVFNGTGARVNVPNSTSLQLTTGMTLEAWVNPATVSSAWRDVIYKGSDNYYLEGTSDNAGRAAGGGTFGGSSGNAFAASALPANTWSHLALTYYGATLRLYVNGVLAGSQAKAGAIATSTNQLQIGGDSLFSQNFNGLIDEVRIYNVPLSVAAIQSDMASAVGTGAPDNQPPSTPTGLAVSGVGQNSMTLSWNAASDNVGVTGYRLFVGSNLVGTSLTTSFLFSGLTCATTYTLGVVAIDAAQNTSGLATTVQQTAACPDTTPPSAPGTLTSSVVGTNEIDLSWGAASDNVGVTGYQVFRCQGSGCTNLALLSQQAAGMTTYADVSLASNTSYTYEVRAVDAAGNLGAFSNTTSAATPASTDTQPPSAPGTLTASTVGSSEIDLSWGAATDNVGVAGYRIDRCTGAGCTDFSHLAQLTGTGTTYKDTALSPSTTYGYQVRALDGAGNLGPVSNTTYGTTQPAPSNGLVAAYAFDDGSGTTATDSSGKTNTGTLVNATWSGAGKFGGALSFNGTARVDVANSTSLQLTSAMTLEAWVNPSTVSSVWRDVIYKGNDNYYLEGTSDHSGAPDAGGTFGGANANAFGTTALPVNTWSHLALTYDGATLSLYVNGALVSSVARTGAIATSTNPLQIGGDGLFGQNFNGLIDEVRIYNTALTAAAIQTDMNTAVAGGSSDAPTAPTNLAATARSSSQIDLSWGASTDAAGVTGYKVERCQGTNCSNFAQIGAPTGTTYSDTGLAATTSYTYRVRAIDALGKLGPYSNPATGFTGVLVTPKQLALTPGQTQQFTASLPGGGSATVNWSVDGIAGGSTAVGTVTSGGLYTAPTAAGTHTVTAATTDGSLSVNATAYITDYAGTFTFHNDNLRTGQNLNETVLTTSNVNSSNFGKLFSLPLDGIPHASPLYVENVSVPGQGTHNLVYVATEHDSVYAYDADGRSTTPIWKDSFIDPAHGVTTVPANDTGECCDIMPEIGITSTPVIDKSTNTMYVVAKTKEVSGGTTYVQRLHALDIATGAEKFGGPVVIQGSVPGSGAGSTGGRVPFDPLRENQRTGLLLSNGVVYFAFASHGDNQPYHGWILGYNATTLQQTLIWNATPDQEGAGIWMSGDGLASDATGSIYFITGDGEFDGTKEFGDSYVRLTPAGVVTDYFAPLNQDALNTGNHDLGAGGALLLPDQPGSHAHEMLGSGKDGTIYLVDRDNMGHFNASANNIVQTLTNIFPNGTPEPGNFSAPVYLGGYVFFGPLFDTVQGFKLTNGLLPTSPSLRSQMTFSDDRGAALAGSANGASNAILWAVQRNGTASPGVLLAFDPANSTGGVLKELYDSSQAGARDTLDVAAKFSIPTVANGKVFVAGAGSLTVYGLLP